MIFSKNDNQYASFEKVYDATGDVYVYAVAHAALTALTPYKVIANEYGPVTAALADGATYFYVGVPEKAYDSGAIAKLKIGGLVEDMVTPSLSVSVGHSLTINTGAVADGGADYSGAAGEFAVCVTASTTSTTQDAMMVPERILEVT